MVTETKSLRTCHCTRKGCKNYIKEKLPGEGFIGYTPLYNFLTDNLVNVTDPNQKQSFHILCPECSKELCEWLEIEKGK